ncbi:hypothetical protein DSL72_002144 [Monilinia vaccinii-corymbosi]|uniref:Uncharacterized protein n=1 Tax=Monilinia vaccinii-corymbosi TaxID=61207 RepID=A0A8A3PBS3_9HELO|nr:hypothetical protein DSL72_002144 [Monilinia vaccinii-corymbosi]
MVTVIGPWALGWGRSIFLRGIFKSIEGFEASFQFMYKLQIVLGGLHSGGTNIGANGLNPDGHGFLLAMRIIPPKKSPFNTTIMQIFNKILPAVLLILTSSFTAGECVSAGTYCTLYVEWIGSPSGPSPLIGNIGKPTNITLFSKSCAVIPSNMKPPTDKGQITVTSPKLPSTIQITGTDDLGRPLFTYNGKKEGHENCGYSNHKGGFIYACTFHCDVK